jgi:succinyl-CoA synthetase alpha subunit
MAILLDGESRVIVQGITGREGSFHAEQMKLMGTRLLGGVNPGKGGTTHLDVPIFNTVAQAVGETGANASGIFVPPPFAADAIMEAAAAGIRLIVTITEGIPIQDMIRVKDYLKSYPEARLLGPNCPGLLTPGVGKIGIIPQRFASPGPVGIVSRSGTLTYESMSALSAAGLGQSTIVGIGGDPVPGTDFIDVIAMFEGDPETELIVMCGEIGGNAEEQAAEFIAESVSKPVVAYIAGFTAPAGKTMGHAGAIVSGTQGTARAKAEALESRGVRVGRTPTEVAEIAVSLLGAAA